MCAHMYLANMINQKNLTYHMNIFFCQSLLVSFSSCLLFLSVLSILFLPSSSGTKKNESELQ